MQIIEVPSKVGATSGVLGIAHSGLSLDRGLEPGEELIVRDPSGEYHAARVTDITFSLEDTHYLLAVGARLTAQMVEQRRRGIPADSEIAETHAVVDLLGDLRRLRAERARNAYTSLQPQAPSPSWRGQHRVRRVNAVS